MTLRVGVLVEGNAESAQKALGATAGALDKVEDAARTTAATVRAGLADQINRFPLAASSARALAVEHDGLTLAAQSEQRAMTAATAATQANTAATEMNASVARRAAMQQRLLAFQLNDVFVSLASGMNPMMVAVQQGSQMAQIYGPGEGGLGRAVQESGRMVLGLVTKFAPLLVVVGLAAAGIEGLAGEVRKSTGVAVSWGDTFLAIFQVVGGGLKKYVIDPVVNFVAPAFQWAWDRVKELTAWLINGITRSFLDWREQIIFIVTVAVPDAFRVGAQAAARAFTGPIESMVNATIDGINSIIDLLNKVGANIAKAGPFKISADFLEEDVGAHYAAEWEAMQKRRAMIAKTDYAGEFFGAISDQAVANFNDRQKDKKVKAAKESDYARELAQVRERTAALQMEQQVVGLSTYAAEKMRKQFELEAAARKDATGLSAARVGEIERESAAYARQASMLQQLQDIYATGKDLMTGVVTGLIDAFGDLNLTMDEAADIAADFFNTIKKKASEAVADAAWDMLFGFFRQLAAGMFGGGGGGFSLGNLFGGTGGGAGLGLGKVAAYADGTDSHPGGWAIAGERGRELMRLPRGTQVFDNRDTEAMLGGGQVHLSLSTTINGGFGMGKADLERILDARDRRIASSVPTLVMEARRRGALA